MRLGVAKADGLHRPFLTGLSLAIPGWTGGGHGPTIVPSRPRGVAQGGTRDEKAVRRGLRGRALPADAPALRSVDPAPAAALAGGRPAGRRGAGRHPAMGGRRASLERRRLGRGRARGGQLLYPRRAGGGGRARHLPRRQRQVPLRGHGPRRGRCRAGQRPLRADPPDPRPGAARRLRPRRQRLGARALRGIGRPLHHAAAAAVPEPARGGGGTPPRRRVRPAYRGDLRLGRRARAGHAPDVGAGLGRRGGNRPAGQPPRQSPRRLAPDRRRRCRAGAAQPVADDRGQLPDGADGRADERRRPVGDLRPPSRPALRARGGRRRLGPVPVPPVRPRIRVRRPGRPRLQARHRALGQAQRVRPPPALLHLRGRGGGRLPPRARDRPRQFPVGQRLPRSRQPVAAFPGRRPCPGRGGAGQGGARPAGVRERGRPLQHPDDLLRFLLAKEAGEAYDAAAFAARLAAAVRDVVARQVAAGIDSVCDGEQSKISYTFYVRHRLSGIGAASGVEHANRPQTAAHRDILDHPDYMERLNRARGGTSWFAAAVVPCCTGPVGYRDRAPLDADLRNLAAAVAAERPAEAFMNAASPGVLTKFVPDRYYRNEDAYVAALADALKEEYEAIVAAGFILQIDAPDLGSARHNQYQHLSDAEFLRIAERNVAAL